jgi:hypothetical protein
MGDKAFDVFHPRVDGLSVAHHIIFPLKLLYVRHYMDLAVRAQGRITIAKNSLNTTALDII